MKERNTDLSVFHLTLSKIIFSTQVPLGSAEFLSFFQSPTSEKLLNLGAKRVQLFEQQVQYILSFLELAKMSSLWDPFQTVHNMCFRWISQMLLKLQTFFFSYLQCIKKTQM